MKTRNMAASSFYYFIQVRFADRFERGLNPQLVR